MWRLVEFNLYRWHRKRLFDTAWYLHGRSELIVQQTLKDNDTFWFYFNLCYFWVGGKRSGYEKASKFSSLHIWLGTKPFPLIECDDREATRFVQTRYMLKDGDISTRTGIFHTDVGTLELGTEMDTLAFLASVEKGNLSNHSVAHWFVCLPCICFVQ